MKRIAAALIAVGLLAGCGGGGPLTTLSHWIPSGQSASDGANSTQPGFGLYPVSNSPDFWTKLPR